MWGKYEFVRLKEGERQQVLMRPDDPLAQKESRTSGRFKRSSADSAKKTGCAK